MQYQLATSILISAGSWSTALAGDCTPSTGPDLIVAEFWGWQHWGAVNSIAGYSFGSESCNIGDEVLPCSGPSNQHPVITMNAFRYMNGRLEQIGMSWAKHVGSAVPFDFCCTCIDPQNSQILGVGCSDPYFASTNGDQNGTFVDGQLVGGLGPRSEVNASTGDFAWPYTTIGQAGDAIYKRLQIHLADLDPNLNAGAIYFAECQYLSPHDTQAGNGNNNNSVRQFTVLNNQFTFQGQTHQMRNAIGQWKHIDSDVRVEIVDVPGDGRIVVGSRATLVNGVWHYEYAVQNLTSHRSVGSFAVDVHYTVPVANIGFHDVDYHSGEPYSATNWQGVIAELQVRWSTDDFNVNENANAIRWSSLYNFRFQSTSPPTASSATIGLFRPGAPQTIDVPVEGPQASPGAFGSNECGQSLLVLAGSHPFSTAGATTDGPLKEPVCNFNGANTLWNDVWFKFAAQCTGTVVLQLCDLDFSAGIAVYSSCPTGFGQAIACSASDCGQRGLTFNTTAGQLYRIRIGSPDNTTGSGTLQISCSSNLPCPADINNNGGVDVSDMLAVINAWGNCPAPCPADIKGSGQVDVSDLLAVINAWGACP